MTSAFAQPHSRSRSQTSRTAGTGLMIGWMLLGLFATVTAMADPQPPIDIHWEAPPACPQESDVRDRLEKLLGSGRHDSHLRAEGTITRIDRRFRLDLVVRVRDLVGTRSIESNACEDLAGAAAVELGLLIHSAEATSEPNRPGTQTPSLPPAPGAEPSSSRSDGTASSSRSDGTEAHPAPGTVARPATRVPDGAKSESKAAESEAKEQPPSEKSQRAWHALVQAPVLELGVGPLPQPARGIGLSLGLEYANWQLQFQGLSWQRQSISVPGYGANIDRVSAAFWGCRELRRSWFGFSPCLTVGMERVSATGTGPNIAPSTQHAMEMTAGAGFQSRIHMATWLSLFAAVGGQIELSRPQISVNGLGSVYQFAPAAFVAALGLEWIL